MKTKHFILTILALHPLLVHSQNETDAIRYSQENLGSTARSYGVAGAFGAIGADPSCANINPAGLARFRTSKLFLSTSFYNAKTKTTYLGNAKTENKFNFNIPNVGFILNIRGNDYNASRPKGFVNFIAAFNVNRINNFHLQSSMNGINTTSSITQEWAERGKGFAPDDMSPYSLEYLAYRSYTIDPDTGSTTPVYKSAYGNSPINGYQNSTNQTKGAMNDNNFSFAANYRHKLEGGISIGFKSVRYIETNSFVEDDKKSGILPDIRSVRLDKYLKTKGVGFNAKLGLVYSPNEFIRIGYSYHTPTRYNLTDSYSYTIRSVFDPGAKDVFGKARVDTTVTTNSTGYNYKITTPARQVLSIGLVNKKLGFISMDAEFVNYGGASLYAGDYQFKDENKKIKNICSNQINIRVGAEVIANQYRFRAGYARYPSPYNSSVPEIKNMVNNIYTLGFGIKKVKYSFDIAYINSGYTSYYAPYTLINGNQPVATNNIRTGNVVISAGINLE